ncbi:DoxX family protein [Edaphobacter modestus]|uniref:DoxX-like protein n=1 Tax=Edaphobacter modestus TaxID=388466 RepID=A0A4Q7YT80_9BACT|nr:DoxX family protein [Edaphobacter modestus]RZU40251.1 DoxX-like protein [Edaphobacter modestus]
MTVDIQAAPSKTRLYTGYTFTTLAVLFLLLDAGMKFTTDPHVVQAQAQLGFPMRLLPGIGVLELVSIGLYVIPATSVLGALMLTGHLGGAIALHLRVDNPLFTHTLFPIYIALFIWGGIWLRDRSLRDLFPVTHRSTAVIPNPSKKLLRTGYVLTAISALFILFTAAMKFIYTPPAGAPPPTFPLHHIHHLAFLEIACTALYLFPATSFLGAVLMTGYLGGATAINLRGGESIGASLIPALVGVVVWAGLWLRELRIRQLFPIRSASSR